MVPSQRAHPTGRGVLAKESPKPWPRSNGARRSQAQSFQLGAQVLLASGPCRQTSSDKPQRPRELLLQQTPRTQRDAPTSPTPFLALTNGQERQCSEQLMASSLARRQTWHQLQLAQAAEGDRMRHRLAQQSKAAAQAREEKLRSTRLDPQGICVWTKLIPF